jgi:hypothetical protein
MRHGQRARSIREVLLVDHLVAVSDTGVRREFCAGFASNARCMRRVAVRFQVWRCLCGGDVPRPLFTEDLLVEMFRLDGHEAVHRVEKRSGAASGTVQLAACAAIVSVDATTPAARSRESFTAA